MSEFVDEGREERDVFDQHIPACWVEGCRKPGHFFLGHGEIRTNWCYVHIAPRGFEWLMTTVTAVRDFLGKFEEGINSGPAVPLDPELQQWQDMIDRDMREWPRDEHGRITWPDEQ